MLKSKREYLNRIYRRLIYGGHFLSIGAVSVVLSGATILGINITWDCLLLVYLGSQIVYLYNRLKEADKDLITNFDRTKYIKQNLNYFFVVILFNTFLFFSILFFLNKLNVILFSILLLLFGILYSKFFKYSTKYIIGFKSLFVSFAWSLLIVFLFLYYNLSFSLSYLSFIIFVFFRLFVHEVFSDLKDIESDKNQKLRTLPIVIGEKKIILSLSLLSFISLVFLLISIYSRLLSFSAIGLSFTFPYSLFYLYKYTITKKKNMNLYYVFADGEYIFWLPFTIIGKILS